MALGSVPDVEVIAPFAAWRIAIANLYADADFVGR